MLQSEAEQFNSINVITSCDTTGYHSDDHFRDATKMVILGIELIIMNKESKYAAE
jgi:hypothetical protein